LPDWVRTEHYDIPKTSTLTTAMAEDRIAMLRAMLADRFLLKVHIETPGTIRMVAAPIRDRQGDKRGRLGDLLEGTATMARLAEALQTAGGARRPVITKMGLPGTCTIAVNFDLMAEDLNRHHPRLRHAALRRIR
jgi:uncharacterized protein (TIGR03435 family)